MRGKVGRFMRRQLPPNAFSGLTGWWDASDASTLFDATSGGSAVAADGQVARLQDKSGSDRHVTQADASFRPIRKTNVQNGRDVLRFDGIDDRLSTGVFSYLALQSTTASTVIVVAKATAVTTNDASPINNDAVFSEGQGAHGAFVLRSNGTVAAFGFAGVSATASLPYSVGSWIVFSSWHNGTTLSAAGNNQNTASAALGTRTFTNGTPRIGTNYNATQFFDGDLGELITYNVALSDADRSSVISFLMDKWGIT